MGFNFAGAMEGLLGAGAQQAGLYADRLGKLEETKLQNDYDARREQAKLVRDKALKDYQYDIDKERDDAKYAHAERMQDGAPKKDNRTSMQKNIDAYGKDEYLRLTKKSGVSSDKQIGYLEELYKKYGVGEVDETEKVGVIKGLWNGLTGQEEPDQKVTTFEQRVRASGNKADIMKLDAISSGGQPQNAGILGNNGDGAQPPNKKPKKDSKPGSSFAQDALKDIKDKNKKAAKTEQLKKTAMSSVDPGDLIRTAENAIKGAGTLVKDSADLMSKVNKLAAEGAINVNQAAGMTIVNFISWIKDVMTADTDQVSALKGTATGLK